MDFQLTDEQRMVRDMVRDLATKEIAPRAAEVDKTEEFPADNIRKMAELGLLGLPYPEEYGGGGGDYLGYAIAVEEIARACGSTALIYAAHVSLGCGPIYSFGSEEQKQKWLPRLCSGQGLGAFGLTEPEAGSDAASIKTTAVKDGDKWILNGTKTFITNATIADVAAVFAYNDRAKGPGGGVTCFLVEAGTKGFRAGKPFDKMGFRGSPTAELILEDCEVPDSAVLGAVGSGFIQAMMTLEYGRIGMATVCLGIASKCLELANKYSKERVVFGKPINRFQEISFKLADMLIMSDTARLLIYQAAWAKETNHPESAVLASVAKLWASETGKQISDLAVQIHGGYGYMKEYPVERLYRDARLGEIGEGASEIQRILIAKDLIRKYAA